MLLPGTVLMLIFNYLPMAGTLMSFKKMQFFSDNIFTNFMESEWVGLKNFEFFFKTPDAFRITRNTVCYNLVFIFVGLVAAIALAIGLNELISKRLSKIFQTTFMLPYFLSWVVVSYIVYSFLNPESGIVNRMILPALGIEPISWYTELAPWPYLLVFLNLWKYTGYNSVVYLAALSGIDQELYEAASIDGAGKLKQIIHITLPHLVPVMTILTILSMGKIVQGDFGLFYFATSQLGNGALKPVADVLDTYVYQTLMNTGDLGMSAAASLYQSVIGFILVLTTNLFVNKLNPDNALF
nr:ABC transporter permease subunit [Neglectibacter timonensis]